MKKIFLTIAAVSLCSAFIATNSMAVGLTQANAGDAVTITVTGTAPAFTAFNPSTNVIMKGTTIATEFAVSAYHLQVLAKSSGKAFGMASDSSAMYYLDISPPGTVDSATDVSASDSTAFSTYTPM